MNLFNCKIYRDGYRTVEMCAQKHETAILDGMCNDYRSQWRTRGVRERSFDDRRGR